jgi:hypothetical protein
VTHIPFTGFDRLDYAAWCAFRDFFGTIFPLLVSSVRLKLLDTSAGVDVGAACRADIRLGHLRLAASAAKSEPYYAGSVARNRHRHRACHRSDHLGQSQTFLLQTAATRNTSLAPRVGDYAFHLLLG